jgi:3-methyladenine DNA glycosylase AlkD
VAPLVNEVVDHVPFLWIEKLIVTKSWWDTVDILATHLAGEYFKKHKNKMNSYVKLFEKKGKEEFII